MVNNLFGGQARSFKARIFLSLSLVLKTLKFRKYFFSLGFFFIFLRVELSAGRCDWSHRSYAPKNKNLASVINLGPFYTYISHGQNWKKIEIMPGTQEPVAKKARTDLNQGKKLAILEDFSTLTSPIGLPPHAPVLQKSADQRWLIANSAKNRHLFYIKWCD